MSASDDFQPPEWDVGGGEDFEEDPAGKHGLP
jgi:hypothetical protein